MSAPDPKPALGDNRIEKLKDPSREQSPNSTDQSDPKCDPAKAQVQPAVEAGAKLDEIENLPSPTPSKKAPRPAASNHLPSTFSLISTMWSVTASCGAVTKDGCGPKGWALIILGFVLDLAVCVYEIKLVELHMACLSLLVYGIFVCSKSIRGKWARQPPIPLAENKRNPYRDVPSVNDEDPMEPACPRPQQEPPKEQVYQVDVHKPDLSSSLSSPSTSTGAKGGDPKGASGGHPPSTSEVVAPVDVHVPSQETEDKVKSSEKDSRKSKK